MTQFFIATGNYDSIDVSAQTLNSVTIVPRLVGLNAYRPLWVVAACSQLSAAFGEKETGTIHRCQLSVGDDASYYSLEDRPLICDARDPAITDQARFRRSGIWEQSMARTDPFRATALTVRCRVQKNLATDILRVHFRLYYEIIPINRFQAQMLDLFDRWIE